MRIIAKENKFEIREIANYKSFLAMRESWNSILLGNSRHTVFLTHEWFDAAWQWRKSTDEICMLCTYSDSALASVFPLVRTQAAGRFRTTELRFLEVPDAQECDIVVADPDAEAAVAASIAHLAGQRDWDIAVFSKLEHDGNLSVNIEGAAAKAGLRSSKFTSGENPGVSLTGGWDAYYKSRSRRLKKGNNLIRNKLHANENTVEVIRVGQGDKSDVDQSSVLSTVIQISSSSWKADKGITLDNPGPREFIIRLTEHASGNGWLSIWLLRLNGVFVAFEYQLSFRGKISALRSDYDPEYSALSPGSYLNWCILDKLFSTNSELYRMGHGDNTYKLRWSNETSELAEVRLYNSTVKGKVLWLTNEVVRPVLRRVKRQALRSFDALVGFTRVLIKRQ